MHTGLSILLLLGIKTERQPFVEKKRAGTKGPGTGHSRSGPVHSDPRGGALEVTEWISAVLRNCNIWQQWQKGIRSGE